MSDLYTSDVDRLRERRARHRRLALTGVLLSVWAGFFWWVGWGQAVVGELFAMALGAGWLRVRRSLARRDWPRMKALGARTRLRCTCDQCQRLRADELIAVESQAAKRAKVITAPYG